MSGHLLSQVLRALARYIKRNNAFSLIIPVVTSVTATGNVSGFPGIGSLSAVPQAPDQSGASAALALARNVVDGALARLAEHGSVDADQVVAYDLAHAAAALETARAALDYGARGEVESALACAFVADAVWDVAGRVLGRESDWGCQPGALDRALPFIRAYRDPAYLAGLAGQQGPRHLDGDFELVQETFRRFAEDRIRPVAEHVHRTNADIPEDIISGLAEMGGFGLSVPEEYGGFASGGDRDYLGMVVATEELSRGSLGVGGSLITRPEILTRALVKGGTEEQKREWLPKIASAEVMVAVAVTEPDFGSDVAGIKVTATPALGADGWVINGVKTWCTFAGRADVFMLLARTDPDRTKAHRGLSLFIVPKPRAEGHAFAFDQTELGGPGAGRIEGRAIDTIGYRGMHSYEVAFDNWWVAAANLIGGEEGQGKGFYHQMEGFENGRLQTAARAIGVMQAAYDAALSYAHERVVFGRPIAAYQLTQAKLARMAAMIQCSRQFMYEVARLMAKGEGTLEASMIKAYVCRAAEWVTREAMQIHGGMGYAEEFAVSRYFVDARVLSIFEGADETLALKVIARRLLDRSPGRATAPGSEARR
jgi:(2S)-methylsuccinyl-CoA dehydrogenase